MLNINKKTIYIIAIASVIIFTAIIGIAVHHNRKPQSNTLPVVSENATTQTATPQPIAIPSPTKDYSKVQLPPSDDATHNNLIKPSENTLSKEEVSKEVAAEKVTENTVKEVTPSQVVAENKKIETAQKAANANPSVQKNSEKPAPVAPATISPKKDDGFICTKDQAIKTFAAAFQKKIDSNSYTYTATLESAKEYSDFSQATFDADLKQLMSNPYSSKRLSKAFDDYRKDGDLGVLMGEAALWLGVGGDDGHWVETATQ